MASLLTARRKGVDALPWLAWGRVGAIAAWLVLALVCHGASRLLRGSSRWPQRFLAGVTRIAGVTVEVRGQPLRRDVLFIANHISWLDIAVLAGKTGSAFVAKAEVAPWPIIGWLATINNSVYVERGARLDVGAQALALGNALTTGQPVTLFPEGTTGDGSQMLPFRSSLIAAVAPPPAGIAIQPVALDYGSDAMAIAWVEDEPIGSNAIRVMARRRPIKVVLHFLEPLPTAEFLDRKAIARHARQEIEAALMAPASRTEGDDHHSAR